MKLKNKDEMVSVTCIFPGDVYIYRLLEEDNSQVDQKQSFT